MIIKKFGVVILSQGAPRIEGWEIELEPEDPADATNEQLLLGFAIAWARERFDAAVNSASMDVFRALAKKSLDAKLNNTLPKIGPEQLVQ